MPRNAYYNIYLAAYGNRFGFYITPSMRKKSKQKKANTTKCVFSLPLEVAKWRERNE